MTHGRTLLFGAALCLAACLCNRVCAIETEAVQFGNGGTWTGTNYLDLNGSSKIVFRDAGQGTELALSDLAPKISAATISGLWTFTTRPLFPSGSDTAPAVTFSGDPASGLFLEDVGQVGLVADPDNGSTPGLAYFRQSQLALTYENASGASLLLDNADGSSGAHSTLSLQVESDSAGDARAIFGIGGGDSWAIGLDNSASNDFIISRGSALGTNTAIRISEADGYATFLDGGEETPSINFASDTNSGFSYFEAGINTIVENTIVSSVTPGGWSIGVPFYVTGSTLAYAATGSFGASTAGGGLAIQEGSNATMGLATLVGGTVTVSTNKIQTGERVWLCHQTPGGTMGHLSLGTITTNTSFVINSSSGTDTSTVLWIIVDPSF